ncbi:MAG: LPXTG cell wall anchor domain-containing protein, partial [Erysipelotrichales bacterium]|nr:LPXTG cell wall anchor domain-containing protein [Erysipelotrichales bacterium]
DYALTENEEDYLSLPGIEETNPDPVSGTVESKDLFTGFTNVRDGIIPTGVLIPVSSGALLIGLGAAVLLRKRREE